MSLFPLDRLLGRLISHGQLTVADADGNRQTFGTAGTGPAATMRIHDRRYVWRILRNPGLILGEGYMDGSWSVEDGTLADLLEIIMVSAHRREPMGLAGAARRRGAMLSVNTIGRARRNIQHHYDLDHRLYTLFLDEDMQYSCGYWRDGVTSLEEAQRDKKRHIARKLLIEPGMTVLDIGSGWGGMALTLARDYGAKVTGVTLSTDQYETSVARAREEGLSDRVTFKLQDYRTEPGAYDRIVSVGMFEHVGRRNFREFFSHLDRLLKPDGIALLHTIGRNTPPEPINAWIRKYIFPGAYLPSLSELTPLIEKHGLWLADLEVWRVHYAKTLDAWHERFQRHRAEFAERFDERFCRMWEFYLRVTATSLRLLTLGVFQLQIAKRIDAVPITRDYLYPAEPVSPAPETARPKSRARTRPVA
ncbi:MAG: class I SAM-dependent methyltransferase [Bauldia sp.]|nr:class I SAM-dependent methyltransferase [Bauldia sp.]